MRTFFISLSLILSLYSAGHLFAADISRNDPVNVIATSTPPVIDGIGDDDCWKDLTWQLIDHVWIEYGQTLPTISLSSHCDNRAIHSSGNSR